MNKNPLYEVVKSQKSSFTVPHEMSDKNLILMINNYLSIKDNTNIVLISNRVYQIKRKFDIEPISIMTSKEIKNNHKFFILSYKAYIKFEKIKDFLDSINITNFILIDDLCNLDYQFSLKYRQSQNKVAKKLFMGFIIKHLVICKKIQIKDTFNIINITYDNNNNIEDNIEDNKIKPLKNYSWDSVIIEILIVSKRQLNYNQILNMCLENKDFIKSHPKANGPTCSTQLLRMVKNNKIKRGKKQGHNVYYI